MKRLLYLASVVVLLAAAAGYYVWSTAMAVNTIDTADNHVLIPKSATVEQLADTLTSKGLIKNGSSFLTTAKWMDYEDDAVRYGRFAIPSNYSNRQLINHLKSSREAPLNVIINNVRKIENLAASVADQLAVDSTELLQAMLAPSILQQYGLDSSSVLSLYIPNTYELYWTTAPEDFVHRMAKEHKRWWSQNDRLQKAQSLGLSLEEVYTLASIVDKESTLNAEKPRIAGVYLNRLKRGMALQADPTVVFASGIFDLKRVLNKHLAIDSPYNTYRYPGLPPGPIYMASIAGLEAVLNAEDHRYLYFCAAPGYGSQHLFAATLQQHNKNAKRFHRWLNSEGIR